MVLKVPQGSGLDSIRWIVSSIERGHYVKKLFLNGEGLKGETGQLHPTSTTFAYYDNNQAVAKKGKTLF